MIFKKHATMQIKNAPLLLFLMLAVLSVQGCSDRKPEEPAATPTPAATAPVVPPQSRLIVKEWGPRETRAGQGFNLQPDGVSAFWFNTDNAPLTTVVVVNEKPIPTVVATDGKLVTAGVPPSIFAKAVEFPVYLMDQKTQEKSNEMKFTVK